METTTNRLDRSVRATVERLITEVVGEEFCEVYDIGLDSTFAEDLELESLEILELAERLIETYEGKVDFVGWFATMEFEELVELDVGTLVGFIASQLAGADRRRAW
ncbi:MAG: acyl carrier protein [Acidimicrobiales bacterium]